MCNDGNSRNGAHNVGNVGAVDSDVIGINGVVNDDIGVVDMNENDEEILLDQTPPIRNIVTLDLTPPIQEVDTPNTSFCSDGSRSDTSLSGSENDFQSSHSDITAGDLLKNMRIKNVNRLIIGTLNINFIAPKFEQLKEVIGNHLDILTIQETKIDKSFPDEQFEIEGYHKPYRLDRSKHGGGVLIYVREDIPTKPLNKHNFTKNIEGMFLEINLRKTKLLYHWTL